MRKALKEGANITGVRSKNKAMEGAPIVLPNDTAAVASDVPETPEPTETKAE